MTTPKRHHFVPEMLQKRFVNRNGQLHAYRRESQEQFTTSPGNLFVERQLYSSENDDGTFDPSLEQKFSYLEGATDPLLERFVVAARVGRAPSMTREDKDLWDTFLYFQMKRVPEFHRTEAVSRSLADGMKTATRELIDRFPERRREIEGLTSGESGDRLKRNARIGALAERVGIVLEAFRQRGIFVIRIASHLQKSFVLGSSPVARLGSGPLDDPNAELWLPIASDVAVGIGLSLIHI